MPSVNKPLIAPPNWRNVAEARKENPNNKKAR